jgi:hypothetical protein
MSRYLDELIRDITYNDEIYNEILFWIGAAYVCGFIFIERLFRKREK